jgi:hypothetical protein
MMKVDELPEELRRLGELADRQPPAVRQAFQFCLAVAMEEDGSAKLINTAQVDGRTWYSYEAATGEVFSVVRPKIDAETEREVREWVGKNVGGHAAPYDPAQGGPGTLPP